jgi:hypothetical protein
MDTLPETYGAYYPSMRPYPDSFSTNLPPAPAGLILRAAVRGWAHMFNKPAVDPMSGRPPRAVWMPAFCRSTGEDDWGVCWLRLAEAAMRREGAVPETLMALRNLEEKGYQKPLLHAFADMLETV